MRTGLLLAILAAPLAFAAGKPAIVIRDLPLLNAYPSERNEGPFGGPKRLDTPEELADHVSDKIWKARFEQNVDFEKESLILFEWYGSKFDQLTAAESKDADGPLVLFTYTKRKIVMRSDGKGFVRAFAIPKKTRISTETEE